MTGFTPAPEAILLDLRIFEESKDLDFLVYEAVFFFLSVLIVSGGVAVIS
jgi:hypothetical protein